MIITQTAVGVIQRSRKATETHQPSVIVEFTSPSLAAVHSFGLASGGSIPEISEKLGELMNRECLAEVPACPDSFTQGHM
jgi:hypothetical protein